MDVEILASLVTRGGNKVLGKLVRGNHEAGHWRLAFVLLFAMESIRLYSWGFSTI